ncbi:VOC family protein, partial [Solicola sp. PLA-1-18]|uniref:VOC family protein n=1 Tax=Solicola sp. PLA-1-18 TaxID=3380532 RepID=UPI003B825CD9
WAEVTADGLTIGLNARETATSGAEGGAVITFEPDDSLESEAERLAGAGVTLTGEVSDHPWGRILPFRDSEGNDLQLYAPPAS